MLSSIKRFLKLFFNRKKSKISKNNLNIIGENPNLLKLHPSVYIGGKVTFFCNAEISIDEHTMIAHNVLIHTATHDYNDHPMWYKRIDRPVKIGKHVWIGTGVIILPGVVIEDYSVIGAGTIVAKNVPRGAILLGNPAKIIKFRNGIENKMLIDNPKKSRIIKGDFLKIEYKMDH